MPEYSQSAYRFGDYVTQFGVFPLGGDQKKLEHKVISDDAPINILSQLCRDYHMKHKVTYPFCAQLLKNLDKQPVNDLGVEWDAKKYPFEQVATLEFEPQDSWIPEFRVRWDDRITVNLWHGLKAHQPQEHQSDEASRVCRVAQAEAADQRVQDHIEPTGLKNVPVENVAPQIALPHQHAVQTVEVTS